MSEVAGFFKEVEDQTKQSLRCLRGHGFGARMLREEACKIYTLENKHKELMEELEGMITQLSSAKEDLAGALSRHLNLQ